MRLGGLRQGSGGKKKDSGWLGWRKTDSRVLAGKERQRKTVVGRGGWPDYGENKDTDWLGGGGGWPDYGEKKVPDWLGEKD